MKFIGKVDKFISKPLVIAFFILLLGGVITYYQNKIGKIEIPEKTKIVVANTNIRRGEEIKGSNLKEKEIYITEEHPEAIKEMKDLVGKIALTNIIADREIMNTEVVYKKDWAKDEERDVGITFEHFTDLVGGTALPGEIVDIMLSYPLESGKEGIKTVIEAVELKDVYDDKNISYKTTKDKFNFKPATILVRITEDEEEAIDIAKKQGRIYLRRHSNYMQVIDIVDDISDEVIISGGE